jgi:hypothetical protein
MSPSKTVFIGLAISALSLFADAFSPINAPLKRVELAREAVENDYLKMVAGGAAAGREEYYEGTCCIYAISIS